MDFFAKLGVDWRLLVFQIINFSIVLLVLRRFLYKPLLDILRSRREKIEEGLAAAHDIETKLKKAEEDYERKIGAARREASVTIERAAKNAEKIKDDILAQAEKDAQDTVKKAEKMITDEKEKAIAEAKGRIAELAVGAAEKILREKIDTEKDKSIIKKIFS